MITWLKQICKRKQTGFTIVEVLVIVVVIGVLAGLSIVGYGAIRRDAADKAIEADLRSMADLQEIYRLDNPSEAGVVYPGGSEDDAFTPSDDNTITVTLKDGGYCIYGYKSGSSFPDANEPMTYDSLAGGLGKTGGACEGAAPSPDPDPGTEPTTNDTIITDVGAYADALQAYKTANGTYPLAPEGEWTGADLCNQYNGDCATGSYAWFFTALDPHWSGIVEVHAFSTSYNEWPFYQYSNEGANSELLYLLEGESPSCGAGAVSWDWGNTNSPVTGHHWCAMSLS